MTTKPLSDCAFAELGLAERYSGKCWAFVPVYVSGTHFGLGIAEANEPGYSPIPLHWVHAESYDAAADMADDLNARHLGLNAEAGARIVCSSMAAGKVRKRAGSR